MWSRPSLHIHVHPTCSPNRTFIPSRAQNEFPLLRTPKWVVACLLEVRPNKSKETRRGRPRPPSSVAYLIGWPAFERSPRFLPTTKMSPTIQSPAPVFSVTALVDGAFKEVSLADYLGQWYIFTRFSCRFFLTCPSQGDPDVLPSVRISQTPHASSNSLALHFI